MHAGTSRSTLRPAIKGMTPAPVRKAVRRTITCANRILVWRQVMRELRGVDADDQLVLQRSFRRGMASAARDLDVWKDPQLIADATIDVPHVGQFGIRAHTDDLYHVLPSREGAVVATIRARLGKGSAFIDAGANIGFFTVLAAKIVGDSGHVFAVEMMPETVAMLREHVASNGCDGAVTIFETAISDTSGDVISAVMPQSKFGRASIILNPTDERERHVEVRTRTLDELIERFDRPIDLIKLDLEGAEGLALKGAARTLMRTRAVIFEQLPGETGAGHLLEQNGFTLSWLDGNNILAVRDET